MRRLGKVLMWLVALVAVIALAVVVARVVNHYRYPEPELAYPDPRDAASYPTDLPGMTVTPIADGPVRGFHLRPDEIRHQGVVLTWGGSDGGPDFEHAELLAREGHEVVSMFYFGQPGQPAELMAVPLETASQAIDWAEANAETVEPITIVGTSKGAELAALLPTYEPRVDNVVLFAPTTHVHQGLDTRSTASSWSYGGEEIPYVATADAEDFGPLLRMMVAMALGYPMHLRPMFEAVMAASEAADKRIDLTAVPGEVLIFAGSDDQLWPAETAAEDLRRDRPERTEVHVYEGAGHVFNIAADHAAGMRMGGSAEANAEALDRSNTVLTQRLAEWASA